MPELHDHWLGGHSSCDPRHCRQATVPSELLTVRRTVHTILVPTELLEDQLPPWDEMQRQIEANAAAFAALPPEEQARVKAEREAAYEAGRCTACGCHPDEHGDR